MTDSSLRLDVWLSQQLPNHSRSVLQKMIKERSVSLNGKPCKAGDRLRCGDHVAVKLHPKPVGSCWENARFSVKILFEDEMVIVVDKPQGLAVHPGAGARSPTLRDWFLHHAGNGLDPEFASEARSGIVHRLDKNTSGVMVLAKSLAAQKHLMQQFKAKSNHRQYLALLDGKMAERSRVIESYLFRDPQRRTRFSSLPVADFRVLQTRNLTGTRTYRWARSEFRRIATYNHTFTLAAVKLATGRTHQIRVHSADLRMPVLCDPIYNQPRSLPQTFSEQVRQNIAHQAGQLLHAAELGFDHPGTAQTVQFQAALPAHFQELIDLLETYKDEE